MFIDDRGRLPIWRWWAACSDRKLVVWRVYVEAQRPGRLSVGLPSGDAYTVLRRQGTTRAPAGGCEIVSATNGAVIWRAGGCWPCCWGRAGQGWRLRAVSVWMSLCVCVSVASSWHGRPCSTMAMALPRNRQRPAPEPCTAHAHHRPGQAIIRHRAND